jgi:DNA-binding MarR family transcriptional regulator
MKTEETARIVRGVLALGRALRAARPEGSASLAAIGILATLRRRGPMTAVRLAGEERLQPQSLTRLLAGLERDGLIKRTAGAADRRERLIEPTRRGLAVLKADIQARRRWLERAMAAALTEAEQAALLEASDLLLRLAAYDAGR